MDIGDGVRAFDVVATRAGRRVEVSTGRGFVDVSEVTRGGTVVRTSRFMSSRVVALVEHPAERSAFHGELSPNQLFHMRPAPGYADDRTPIRGLYQASSATHAGGGVTGMPGHHAVREIVRDRTRKRG